MKPTSAFPPFTRLLFCSLLLAPAARAEESPVSWQTRQLSEDFFSEGGAIADLNGDGHADLISGPYWYEGPDFETRHELYPPETYEPRGYSQVFFMFADDINGNGRKDVLIFGWPGEKAWWLENPGAEGGAWQRHDIVQGLDGESPDWVDLTGDGSREIVGAHGGSFGYWRPGEDPREPWTFTAVTPPEPRIGRYAHGMGVGDVDGDGLPDLLDHRGWWRNPGADQEGFWTLHPVPFRGNGGAQILVHDFNGDGLADLLNVDDPHGYGMCWYQQVKDKDGSIRWREHVLMTDRPESSVGGLVVTQLHALALADVDGDGTVDVITGKRWWAHAPAPDGSGGDPGVNDPSKLFWLRVTVEDGEATFTPHVFHDDSGVGVQLPIGDATGNGRVDVLTANKKGTFLHLQTGD